MMCPPISWFHLAVPPNVWAGGSYRSTILDGALHEAWVPLQQLELIGIRKPQVNAVADKDLRGLVACVEEENARGVTEPDPRWQAAPLGGWPSCGGSGRYRACVSSHTISATGHVGRRAA
jgi:hypothetical protein